MELEQKDKRKKGFRSVKSKLIVGMISLAITPSILLGTVSTLYTKNVLEEEISSSSLQLTKEINHSIDNYLSSVKSQIDVASNNINFKTFYENDMNGFYGGQLLLGIKESNDDYLYAYFASTKKDFVIQPEEDMPSDYDPTTRDWYTNAVEANGEFVINEPYLDALTKETVVTASRAVINNGEVMGVVAIDLNLQAFSEEINKITVGEAGYAFILSSTGVALAHKDQKVMGTDHLTKLKLWEDIASNEQGLSIYEVNGDEKLSAFFTNEQTGWKIVSSMDKQEIVDSTKGITMMAIILVVVFAIISSLIAYFFGRKIANNLAIVKDAFLKASKGDLTTKVSVNANDEFKELEHSFNGMMDNLSKTLEGVQSSAKSVLETSASLSIMTAETSASSLEVAKAIEEIASGTSSQAENAQTSASEMNNLSIRLDGILLSTNEVSTTSKHSEELSKKGLSQVDLLSEKSSQTRTSTTEVGEIVNEVSVRMEEINKIVETISKITEQTNLLSLNASIESARAGEHGKGFAVVANEVRNLADQSKANATEIMKIVNNIKDVVRKAVTAMEQTQNVVGEQEKAVEETKVIFTDILNAINAMAKKSEEVSESVLESQRNKEMVVQEIEHISAVSQQTASSAEEVSASAEEISATMEEFSQHTHGLEMLSKELEREIKNFKLK